MIAIAVLTSQRYKTVYTIQLMPFFVIEFKRCVIDYAAFLIDEGNLGAWSTKNIPAVNSALHTHYTQLLICIIQIAACVFSPRSIYIYTLFFTHSVSDQLMYFGLSVYRIA